ncbi:MAG: acetyltransferase [Hyphomicrobiaceae bacterium]
MARKLAIVGAGGLAREILEVVLDINCVTPTWDIVGFVVIGDYSAPEDLHNYPVFRALDSVAALSDLHLVIAVGNPASRHRVASRIPTGSVQWASLIHPRAWIGRHVEIGHGTVVCAGASITTDIRLGQHVLVDRSSTIGHDAVLDDFVTLNPGTCIAGRVHLETGVECGTGAILIPDVRVGAWSILGAGTVVTNSLPPNVTAVGSPARITKVRPTGWHANEET